MNLFENSQKECITQHIKIINLINEFIKEEYIYNDKNN